MRSGRKIWRARAEALAEAIPRERLHPSVLSWADARPLREGWAVAFSGGADSLALLLLLWAHWPRRRSRLLALHFNHRLRGAAADQDARFCARTCRALGVRVAIGAWTARAKSAGEAGARAARFAFFERTMRAHRVRSLWLGHQQDDIAETMLMRLSRGSGTSGLAAPRPLQRGPAGRTHLRPLLELKKLEIAAALRSAGIPWREDESNAGGDFFRNRIRRSVVPAWTRASGRDAPAGAARSRELLEEDDQALEAWVESLELLTPGGRLRLDRLKGCPRAVIRRSLHQWILLQPRAGELSRQGFTALLAAVERGRPTRQSLGSAGFATIKDKWLAFESRT